jgi:serine/threonine protein kinase
MVFERLGMSLYDFIKMNNYRGFDIEYIQSFAKQILSSISFMHSIGLTHTDLKPENILLVDDEYVPLRSRRNCGMDDRSSTCSRSQEKIYYRPRYDKIKIIDMGGATYDDEHHSSIINTRQYRAPEVMLSCCKWSHASDVWSIGCILLELFSGDLFFQTHDTYEHLAMIDKACGPIPYWMGNRADSKLGKHFILEEGHFKKYRTYFDWPKYASGIESIQAVKYMRLINEIIPARYRELRDLIKRMLTIDPKVRITCDEALKHEFFQAQYKGKV